MKLYLSSALLIAVLGFHFMAGCGDDDPPPPTDFGTKQDLGGGKDMAKDKAAADKAAADKATPDTATPDKTVPDKMPADMLPTVTDCKTRCIKIKVCHGYPVTNGPKDETSCNFNCKNGDPVTEKSITDCIKNAACTKKGISDCYIVPT